jgi:hypothetical protein
MKNASPKVDAYIAKSPPFAQPILKRLRRLFHKGCPQVEETMKWGVPHFEHQGVLAGMAAFKLHVRFGFWKASLINKADGVPASGPAVGMGDVKYTDVSQLPADAVLLAWIHAAVELNENNIKVAKKKGPMKMPATPPELLAALKKNKAAAATFENFPPSHRKEYIEWVADAKQEATRQRRIATAIEWMAEGKPKNWKYMKKK